MNLKLKESILCGGTQYLPPVIVDTKALGISDAEADVLIRRGTAELVDAAPSETIEVQVAQPSVVADAAPVQRKKSRKGEA